MHQDVFHILPKPKGQTEQASFLSFKPFISYLKEKKQTEKSLRSRWYDYILQKFLETPEIANPVNVEDMPRYSELLDLMYTCLFPSLSDETEVLWALSAPNSDAIFYSTDAFFKRMSPANPDGMYTSASKEEKKAFRKSLRQVKDALVMERIYHLQPAVKDEIVYSWTDRKTGLPRYYNISIDTRFVEVIQLHQEAPEVISSVSCLAKNARHMCEMENEINLDNYRFEGFSIVRARNVTQRYSLHKMRSAVLKHEPNDLAGTYTTMISLLKSLCGIGAVEFGLLPLLRVNGKPVSLYSTFQHSIVLTTARKSGLSEAEFYTWIAGYFNNPQPHFIEKGEVVPPDNQGKKQFVDTMFSGNTQVFCLLPVYYHDEIAGVLEMSSDKKDVVTQQLMGNLEAAIPILSQLMHTNQTEFRFALDGMIKNHFTAIQPAVQWRFNEVAWQYLKNQSEGKALPTLEPIRFEDVFPLYGAVDIRNSTIERNSALYKDMLKQFSTLRDTLEALYSLDPEPVADLLAEARELEPQTESLLNEHDEAVLNTYLAGANVFIRNLCRRFPEAEPLGGAYLATIDPDSGLVHEHRHALELSIQTINAAVSASLENMQAEIEKKYPAYFEKFRTDGIEYDIYFGQSINPELIFNAEDLGALRMLQIRSMASIVNLVKSQELKMILPLQTTQLIYLNAYSIDISFRTDEKRFDAEGGYNIRYHIIKKRIDKVRVKATGERLTQPGKIAIVYSRKSDEEQFLGYIRELQDEGILLPETEQLALEELQGVTGLKAMRVTVAP